MDVIGSQREFTTHWMGALCAYGEQLGLPLSERKADLLLRHLWLVLSEGRVVNLTSIADPSEAIVKHVVDSMLVYRAQPECDGMFIDMGTGAGYPGIVYGILSNAEGVLLDSVARKIDFCQYAIKCLGLTKLTCVRNRVEEYARQHQGEYQRVLSRAVDEPAILMEYAQPLMELRGTLITTSGSLTNALVDRAEKVADLLGFRSVSRETLSLPHAMGTRTIDVYEKVAPAEISLPRKVGLAKKRPLYVD